MSQTSDKSSRETILGMELDQLPPATVVNDIAQWAAEIKTGDPSRYVCVSNVHQCMESFDDENYQRMINGADIVVPDSQVLIWFQKFLGFKSPQPVLRGQHLTEQLCEIAAREGIRVGFYGGTNESLERMITKLQAHYPGLKVSFAVSPPFRDITEAEDVQYVRQINESNTQMLFVGIGCPKQERWMAEHADRLSTVMLGVGAAFDFIADVNKKPPAWVHPMGLEWFYRLCIEPRRLWKRYLKHNPRFVFYCLLQKLGKSF